MTISAISDGTQGSKSIFLLALASAVVVTPDTATLTALGDIVRLAAVAQTSDGSVIVGKPITWSSSDNAVVSVDAAGLAA